MRIALAIVAIFCLMTTCSAYTRLQYNNGDEILRKLQLKDDKTYVLFIFDAPGTNRDLRTTNDYYKDRLRAEILEPNPDAPTDYIYAEVDATDMYGNGYLIDRLTIDRSILKEKPNVVIMKNGKGNLIYGPTAMNSIKLSIPKLDEDDDDNK